MDNFYLAVRLADALADYLLAGKTDKHGQPLINHARRVARKCKDLSHEQYIAALLHDCLEDGSIADRTLSILILKLLFGAHVKHLVLTVSRPLIGHQYMDYIKDLSEVKDAIPIKLADLEDNLDESRGPIDDSLRDRYKKAHAYLRSVLEERK